MDSPDYSDSEDSSSGTSSTDGPSIPPSVRPNTTDLGKRVIFTSGNDKKLKFGVLRFYGETLFAEGVWCGVELDQPVGKNNGSIQGIRYFTCNNNHGVFIPVQRVELDMSRRSRSRPNSQPSSRATSMERRDVPSTTSTSNAKTAAMTGNALSCSVNIKGISMQQELVSRLSQPRRSSHPANPSSNRRQPMKAFATKGIEAKVAREEKKLAPFRTGGMYKAASTENIRGMKDKDKTKSGSGGGGGGGGGQKMLSGMPGRQKSSSERDLRNAGKSSGGGGGESAKKVTAKPTGTEPAPKPKWNQTRTISCSDIQVLPPTPSSATPPDPSTASSKSSTTSSSSHTSLENYRWPRTSTPGNRDELTPDGCSSPEESVNCRSSQTKVNKGFIETPDEPAISKLRPYEASEHDGEEVGLANHVKRFTEAQGGSSSSALGYQSVQSPDQLPHGHQRLYKNRPSGTATLDHPLVTSIINDGENILKKLLGPNNSVSLLSQCSGVVDSL